MFSVMTSTSTKNKLFTIFCNGEIINKKIFTFRCDFEVLRNPQKLAI